MNIPSSSVSKVNRKSYPPPFSSCFGRIEKVMRNGSGSGAGAWWLSFDRRNVALEEPVGTSWAATKLSWVGRLTFFDSTVNKSPNSKNSRLDTKVQDISSQTEVLLLLLSHKILIFPDQLGQTILLNNRWIRTKSFSSFAFRSLLLFPVVRLFWQHCKLRLSDGCVQQCWQ